MIEKTILDHLASALQVPVYMAMPHPDVASYVVIEKSGGGETDHIYSSLITIRSYAPSMYAAALLNENVKTAMGTLVEHDDVAKCQLNSDYAYPDTRTHRYRYQCVYDIVHY